MSKNEHDSVEHELSVYEHTVIYGKLAAGMLALTYMAGYLVATSYLETYGIHLDSSETFRAKYIYIGLLYWLFLSIFVVFAIFVKRCLNSLKAVSELEDTPKPKIVFKPSNKTNPWKSLFHLRWSIAVSLILLLFLLPIMFLNSETFQCYLPLQAFCLMNVFIFQSSFFWEYSKETYAHGVTDVLPYVEWARWTLVLIPWLIIVILMAIPPLSGYEYFIALPNYKILFYSIIVAYMLTAFILTNRNWVMKRDVFNNGNTIATQEVRGEILGGIAGGVLSLLIGLLWLAITHFGINYSIPWSTIGHIFVWLFCALIVLTGILVFALNNKRCGILSLLIGALLFFLMKAEINFGSKDLPLSTIALDLVLFLPILVFILISIGLVVWKRNNEQPRSKLRGILKKRELMINIARIFGGILGITLGGMLGLLIGPRLWFALKDSGICEKSISQLWPAIVLDFSVLLLALIVLSSIFGLSIMSEYRESYMQKVNDYWSRSIRELDGDKPRYMWKSYNDKSSFIRMSYPKSEEVESSTKKVELWFMRIVPALVLYVVSVLGFAYFIYPFIPVEKSGGDYTNADTISVHWVQQTSAGACPNGSLPSDKDTYYLLEEDMNWVYLAKYEKVDGPKYWRFGAIDHKYRPKVYTIKRSCVAYIETEDQKTITRGGKVQTSW